MWSHSSSATTEQVRVTATSRCIGTSSPTSHFPPAVSPSLEIKHRFAYRIRIENLSDEDHVQLLGRYWCIEEEEEEGGSEQSVEPVIVDAPRTGAGTCVPKINYLICMKRQSHVLVSVRYSSWSITSAKTRPSI